MFHHYRKFFLFHIYIYLILLIIQIDEGQSQQQALLVLPEKSVMSLSSTQSHSPPPQTNTVRPMGSESHTLVQPFMWGILYPCGWKFISQLSIYVRYIVPLRLENHILVIHLCEVYSTPAVGKSYLSSSIHGESFNPNSSTNCQPIHPFSGWTHQLNFINIQSTFICLQFIHLE